MLLHKILNLQQNGEFIHGTIGQLTDVFLVLMSPEFPVTTPLLDMTSTDLSYWMRKLHVHVVLEVGKKDSSM